MLVELNPDLAEVPMDRRRNDWRPLDAYNGIARSLPQHDPEPISRPQYPEGSIEFANFFYALSYAYSYHLVMRINPHDLWMIFLSEVAGAINASPDTYRSLFTDKPEGKINLKVQTNDITHLPIDSIMDLLRIYVPVDPDKFVPAFSTHTEMSRLACTATFLDAVKSYYSYMTFCCGLRGVEIMGTVEDWRLFETRVREIGAMFAPFIPQTVGEIKDTDPFGRGTGRVPRLSKMYFDRLAARIAKITASLEGGDTTFYQTIYSETRVGSGGQVDVNGWISEFYTDNPGRFENYPKSWAIVPYKNLETEREFTAVYSAFHGLETDGVLEVAYSHYVFEQMSAEAIAEKDKAEEAKREAARQGKVDFRIEKTTVSAQSRTLPAGVTFTIAPDVDHTKKTRND